MFTHNSTMKTGEAVEWSHVGGSTVITAAFATEEAVREFEFATPLVAAGAWLEIILSTI